MMFKLTNRKRLRGCDWLNELAEQHYSAVKPPLLDGLGIQQVDLAAGLNSDLVVEKINDAFQDLKQKSDEPPTKVQRVGSDGLMAVLIHKALESVSRRQASDPDLWAYLATYGCPQYTRWRWPTKSATALWTRFAGNTRRNALARLWWWAEITHNPSKPLMDSTRYQVTLNVRDRQSLMLWCVDCAFSGHLHVLNGLSSIQEKRSLDDDEQKKLCRSVNRLARVVCLDFFSDAEMARHLCDRAYQLSTLLRV